MTNWQFYYSRESSGAARSTSVDLALASTAPQAHRPHLAWVSLGMRKPNAHGLVGNDESAVLDEIEKKVAAQLHEKLGAIHIARVHRERRCELWFYTGRIDRLEQTAAQAMSGFSAYRFESGSRSDAKWIAYFQEYYPTDPKRWHQIVNQKLVQTLKLRGEAFDVPHRVDHTLFFKSLEARERFLGTVMAQGYAVSGQFESRQDNAPVFGVVVHQQLPKINLPGMNEAVFRLIDLAAPLGGTYDGWGTKRMRAAS